MMAVHDSYAAAFAAFSAARPASERSARAQAFATFSREGLPDRSLESWRYTDLRPLGARSVQLPQAARLDVSPWRLAGCEEHLWINGQPAAGGDGALPHPLELHAHAGLAGLHRAFARPGLQLALGADQQLETPAHLLTVTSGEAAGAMHHLAHRLQLARGARATLIVQNVGVGTTEHFSTQSLLIDLAEGTELTVIRVQDENTASTAWLQTQVTVGRDARFELVNVDLGGALIRNDWQVKLAAPGATAEVAGLFAADGRTHLDNQYEIEHAAPHGRSRETFRGLAFGRSQSILNGRVVVRPGAAKTDSEQRIASLMLSKGAEICAKPELEIYADDVKCAHGASCGQLDEHSVFYLRSRGVPEAQARALLTYSFANEILRRIAHEALRQRVTSRLAARLGATLDLEMLRA